MPDLEKVIKKLKEMLEESKYNDSVQYNPWADTETLEDAIALLKAQEPRVFNVWDFFGEEFGYLEYMADRQGFSNFEPSPVLIGDIDEENVTVIFRSASVQKLPLGRINKNWRIWSDYPTHELLKAVKWDD